MRVLTFFAIFSTMIFVMVGCPRSPVNPPPDADASSFEDSSGPVPIPPGGSSCATWCARASELHCPAAQPTSMGAACVDVCTNMLTGPAMLDVACRTAAQSCAEADACENKSAVKRSDAALIPVDETKAATCAGWCKHAEDLHCPAAQATPGGAKCSEVCGNLQSGPKKWNLKCRISAKTCAAADACEM